MLSSPMLPRVVFALATSAAACLTTIFLVRRLRHALTENDPLGDAPEPERFPLHTYHAVIQELKQQKHELQTAQQAERRRAKTSENISAAILSHLSSGVMFFTPNGLVRQANAAAKNILGYASPLGMSTQEIFCNSTLSTDSTSQPNVASAIGAALQDDLPPYPLQVRYVSPIGTQRILEITLTTVRAPAGDILGVACLIADKTEVATIQQQDRLRGEVSAEMALALRNSLAAINGYARQVAGTREPEQTRELAADIISETAHLQHTIGGFLADAKAAGAGAD